MRKTVLLLVLAVAATLLFGWTLLDRRAGGGAAGSPFEFAPADTPYAFGLHEPLPAGLAARWLASIDPALPGHAEHLRRAAREPVATAGGLPAWAPALLEALADEIDGRSTDEILARAGLSAAGRMALYGIELLPVLRWELADAEAFHAFVVRLEQRAGSTLATATVGPQRYWRLPLGSSTLELVAAVVDRHLVLSLAPAEPAPELLQSLLGLARPPQSLAASGRLEALVADFGFQRSLLGVVDGARLAALLSTAPGPVARAFLVALALPEPDIDPSCQAEAGSLARWLPRIAFGYTRLDEQRVVARTVFETAPEIAAALQSLRAPLPAAAAGDDALLHVGLSLAIDAIPPLVERAAAAIAAQPFRCPALTGINAAAAALRVATHAPALYAAAPLLRGVHLIVERIEFDAGPEPRALAGAVVFGSPNPKALLAAAAMVAPPAASLRLEPDGRVQPLALPALPGLPALPAWVAMQPQLLGIAVGEGGDRRLPGYLRQDERQQPLLVFGASQRLYAMIADALERAAAMTADPQPRAELLAQAAALRDGPAAWFERSELRVELTAHGIEVLQTVELRR
jgi:hypothetical protein